MSRRTQPTRQAPYLSRLFVDVVRHALPHRRIAAEIAAQLADYDGRPAARGRGAWLTGCRLAHDRGVKHRSAQGKILKELINAELITVHKYHSRGQGGGFRKFSIHWAAITAYAKAHGITPGNHGRAGRRTAAAYAAERAQHVQAAIEARKARETADRARQAAIEQQAAALAISPRERLQAILDAHEDGTAPLDFRRRMRIRDKLRRLAT